MKKNIIKIASFILSFSIGVVLIQLHQKFPYLYKTGAGRIADIKRNGIGSFSIYKSIDGIGLSAGRMHYESNEVVKEAFNEEIENAAKVLERGAIYDKENKVAIGERVVIRSRLGRDDSAETYSILCIIDGDTTLYTLSSTSLPYLLALERQVKRYALRN